MKVIFNLGQESEIMLEFDQVSENYFAQAPQTANNLSLDLRKFDLIPTESMIDYCDAIINHGYYIDTIHCYNTTEDEEDTYDENLLIVFNRYHMITSCKTILDGSKNLETNNSDGNPKVGILSLIQTA